MVIRKTYGFQKQEDVLKAPQLATVTGLDRANVIRAINELVVINVVNEQAGQYGQMLQINKDYES
ncbi:MAG: replication protein [Pseudomonadota bacterium]